MQLSPSSKATSTDLSKIAPTRENLDKLKRLKALMLEKQARDATAVRAAVLSLPEKIKSYFPDEGPLRRELYVPHMEFFKNGAVDRERLFLAANRVGKTIEGGYELTCHMTGEYPAWWEGRRFDGPVDAWAAGDTAKTVRDIQQLELLGPVNALGTGLIPARCIVDTTPKGGTPDAIMDLYVRHTPTGGISTLGLKSYDQKRKSFQGTAKHVIWLDEEPDMGIYGECLTRTMTVGGIIMCTFTPLLGMSEVVRHFLPGGKLPTLPEKAGMLP